MRRVTAAAATSLLLFAASSPEAALWLEATATTIGPTAEWSNKVELADVNGDGLVDILFANGGNYSSAGEPQQNTVFLNMGPGMPFLNASSQVFGDTGDLARSIKVVDLSGDGVADIVVATTYQTRSRLYLGLGAGEFVEVTQTHTPPEARSFGDVEAGDVDDDGDIDLVFADWGPGNPASNQGGVTRVWLNNGQGAFIDATAQRMPFVYVRWSWDLELVDVDDDFDLDIMVSCKSCDGQFLLENDGDGYFDNVSHRLPNTTNNYEFAPMDLDGDGDIDVATVNDGGGLAESLLINDGGAFTLADEAVFPAAANVGEDDNVVEWLDVDSDGDPDFLIGSLSGADRLLSNEGGVLALTDSGLFEGSPTPGTLGMAYADLNGDMKLDVVMSQGETADPEAVFLGDELAPDAAAPVIGPPRLVASHGQQVWVHARIHDFKSPSRDFDWSEVSLTWSLGESAQTIPMHWYGEYLWRAVFVPPHDGDVTWSVCATDRAGNTSCTEPATEPVYEFGPPPPGPEPQPEPAPESGPGPDSHAEVAPEQTSGDPVHSEVTAGALPEETHRAAPGDSGGCGISLAEQPVAPWPALWLLGVLTAVAVRRWSRVQTRHSAGDAVS